VNYSEMSDFEINKAVAVLFWNTATGINEISDKVYVYDGRGMGGLSVDYCNNPSDAWPIIMDNAIVVSPKSSKGKGLAWDGTSGLAFGHRTYDDNPLRAAMIVFLKMQEVAK